MKAIMILIACAGIFIGCTATVPKELANAREAYRRVNPGLAAKIALAEVQEAREALAKAEQSFIDAPDSYKTRDLAYVAQRKAEIADATACATVEWRIKTQARSDYQTTQNQIVVNTKQDLLDTRTALAASEHSEAMTKQDLSDTRTALAASEQSGGLTADQLSAEKEARIAAEKRATDAQAALANLAAVRQEPRGMVITISGSVLFASNQTALLPEAQSRLDRVSDVLLTTPERHLAVAGYTDSQGSEKDNLDLSQHRAEAVRDYLVKKGYQAGLIQAVGLGEDSPVADNANAEGRANNRRVEIIVEQGAYTSN